MSKKTQPPIVPEFSERPNAIINAVKALRATARDPDANAEDRKKFQRLLKEKGLDEESVPDKDLDRVIKEQARLTLAELRGE